MAGKDKQVSGALEYIKGKLQRALGSRTHDRSMQAKGYGNQAKGGAKYETGKVEGKLHDLGDKD